MNIGEVSWLDFVGLALSFTFIEEAITSVGATILKGHRNWRVAPKFRYFLGLAGVGLLELVAADILTRFNLLSRR